MAFLRGFRKFIASAIYSQDGDAPASPGKTTVEPKSVPGDEYAKIASEASVIIADPVPPAGFSAPVSYMEPLKPVEKFEPVPASLPAVNKPVEAKVPKLTRLSAFLIKVAPSHLSISEAGYDKYFKPVGSDRFDLEVDRVNSLLKLTPKPSGRLKLSRRLNGNYCTHSPLLRTSFLDAILQGASVLPTIVERDGFLFLPLKDAKTISVEAAPPVLVKSVEQPSKQLIKNVITKREQRRTLKWLNVRKGNCFGVRLPRNIFVVAFLNDTFSISYRLYARFFKEVGGRFNFNLDLNTQTLTLTPDCNGNYTWWLSGGYRYYFSGEFKLREVRKKFVRGSGYLPKYVDGSLVINFDLETDLSTPSSEVPSTNMPDKKQAKIENATHTPDAAEIPAIEEAPASTSGIDLASPPAQTPVAVEKVPEPDVAPPQVSAPAFVAEVDKGQISQPALDPDTKRAVYKTPAELASENIKLNADFIAEFSGHPESLAFAKVYPVKDDMTKAFKIWRKLAKKDPKKLLGEILPCLIKQLRLPKWNDEFPRFIPNASTYLENYRWRDMWVTTASGSSV